MFFVAKFIWHVKMGIYINLTINRCVSTLCCILKLIVLVFFFFLSFKLLIVFVWFEWRTSVWSRRSIYSFFCFLLVFMSNTIWIFPIIQISWYLMNDLFFLALNTLTQQCTQCLLHLKHISILFRHTTMCMYEFQVINIFILYSKCALWFKIYWAWYFRRIFFVRFKDNYKTWKTTTEFFAQLLFFIPLILILSSQKQFNNSNEKFLCTSTYWQ